MTNIDLILASDITHRFKFEVSAYLEFVPELTLSQIGLEIKNCEILKERGD